MKLSALPLIIRGSRGSVGGTSAVPPHAPEGEVKAEPVLMKSGRSALVAQPSALNSLKRPSAAEYPPPESAMNTSVFT